MSNPAQPLQVLNNYYVLDEPLQEDKIDKLLGRVVLQKMFPLQAISPDLPVTAPQKLVPELMGNEGTILEMKSSTMQNESDKGLLKVASLLNAKAKASHGLSASFEAATLTSYQMTQIHDNVAKLNQKPEWAKPVKDLFTSCEDKPESLPIITKVLVAENMTINYETDVERELDGSIKLPVAAAASHGVLPKGPGDLTAGASHLKSKKVENHKSIKGRVVVALAYSEAHHQPKPAQHGFSFRKLRELFQKKGEYEIVVRQSTTKPFYLDKKEVESDSSESMEEEKQNTAKGHSEAVGPAS